MQNSLVNKIKKNISLEDQVIIEAEYLLENIELFENKDLVLDKLNKIKKTSVDRKIYLIELLKLIENNNVSNLTDCLKKMNDNLRQSEKELIALQNISNQFYGY